MARTSDTFKEYPSINEAYIKTRERISGMIGIWNRTTDDTRFHIALVDVSLLNFFHACVPTSFYLPELARNANGIRQCFKKMLYPLLKDGSLYPDEFIRNLEDNERLKTFMKDWTESTTPQSKKAK